jgi:hypothetical protein
MKQETIDVLTITLVVIMIASSFMIGTIVGNYEGEESGLQKGMNQAELNCLKLICDNNDCSTIQTITEVQNYCKSLVYGTDFYMKVGK